MELIIKKIRYLSIHPEVGANLCVDSFNPQFSN